MAGCNCWMGCSRLPRCTWQEILFEELPGGESEGQILWLDNF